MHGIVYLDQVAVESLLTSLLGVVPANYELKHARESSVSASMRLGGSASDGSLTASVLKAAVNGDVDGRGSRIRRTEALTSGQVSAQAKFNLFRQNAQIHAFESLNAMNSRMLGAGSLVDCEVAIRANGLYSICLAMDSLSDIAELAQVGLINNDAQILQQAQSIATAVRKLMAGLTPIEGSSGPSDSDQILLVGMTEEAWYWRDARTLLFADQRVHVIARLLHSGMKDSWNPLKVMDVFGSRLVGEMSSALSSVRLSDMPEPAPPPRVVAQYAEELFKEYEAAGIEVGPARTASHEWLEGDPPDTRDLDAWRAACNRVDARLAALLGPIELTKARVELRQAALEKASLRRGADAVTLTPVKRYVEAEILAIYW